MLKCFKINRAKALKSQTILNDCSGCAPILCVKTIKRAVRLQLIKQCLNFQQDFLCHDIHSSFNSPCSFYVYCRKNCYLKCKKPEAHFLKMKHIFRDACRAKNKRPKQKPENRDGT